VLVALWSAVRRRCPKHCHTYKKTMECPIAVPVALWSAVRRRCPKRCHAYEKTVECPIVVPVALSTMVRRAKQRVARLCRLLMSANTGKHGIGCKPCDAH